MNDTAWRAQQVHRADGQKAVAFFPPLMSGVKKEIGLLIHRRSVVFTVILAGIPLISGCVTTSNSFISYEAVETPEEMVGIWTGASLGATTTYVINQDGTGIVCNDFNSTVNIDRLKYIGDGDLAYGKGFTFSIERDGDLLISSWYGSGMEMVRDPELQHAAITCVESLQSYL